MANKEVKEVVSQATQIWNDLKDREFKIFAIPATVADYCSPIDIEPEKCYMTARATAVLPMLEDHFGVMYKFSQVDKYIVVEKK